MHRATRLFFALSALYGILVLLPLYAVPDNREPHALYIYGFAGAALATQLAYALVALDPRRFRPVMLVGIFSKLSFALPAFLLASGDHLPRGMLPFAAIDLALAIGFALAWLRTPLARPAVSR